MAIKINIGIPSLKKTKQIELSDEQSKTLFDKRIGDTIKGELVDLPGYQFEITGGSDNAGFPMRKDVRMSGRKKILITRSKGNRDTHDGRRLRKTVAGAIIYTGTAQVNLKTLKEGKQSLFEEPKAEEPAAEEPAAKDTPKVESKAAEKPKAPTKDAQEKPKAAPEEPPAEKPE